MKKSIKDFQVEKLENRKEFIFYCLPKYVCEPKPTPPNPCNPDDDNNSGGPKINIGVGRR